MELAGQFLVAMPGMSDPRFARSVIFLCAYSDDGAMGLVINRRAKDITLADVFERMSRLARGRACLHGRSCPDRTGVRSAP